MRMKSDDDDDDGDDDDDDDGENPGLGEHQCDRQRQLWGSEHILLHRF